MVWQASRAVKIPICGMGGITSAEDAVKFLLCGATAVQVGTAELPRAAASPGEVADGLVAYAERHGIARLADLTGALELRARLVGAALEIGTELAHATRAHVVGHLALGGARHHR